LNFVTVGRISFTLEEQEFSTMAIEIHNPELEKRLAAAAAQAGRPADDLAQDAIAGYLTELAETREMRQRKVHSGRGSFCPAARTN
jgi:hypothetical protein